MYYRAIVHRATMMLYLVSYRTLENVTRHRIAAFSILDALDSGSVVTGY